ncbi:hypothetical protein ACFVUS_32430 [Nocardia sp. NPDC058058]|uniref:hypothetical protein n=1 Tax=Nocardia sp. NPDC058058 TaxID=3346317 RepID=UPI0036D80348
MTTEFGPGLPAMGIAVEDFRLSLELNNTRPEDARAREAAFAHGMAGVVRTEGGIAERPTAIFRAECRIAIGGGDCPLVPGGSPKL